MRTSRPLLTVAAVALVSGCAHNRPAFYPSDMGRRAWKEKTVTVVDHAPAFTPGTGDSRVAQKEATPRPGAVK